MRIIQGSDWLLEQEQLAKKTLAKLKQTPTRTWTKTEKTEHQLSVIAQRFKFILKLLFWTGPLLFFMSACSFCMLLFTTVEGELKPVIEVLALPVAFPVILFFVSVVGGNLEFKKGLSTELMLGFLLSLILIYFLLFIAAYFPLKRKYKTKTITIHDRETPAQKRQREASISEWQSKLRNIRAGREGEEQTCVLLDSCCNDEWTLFRNVTLPDGRHDDIDAVLVGPTGVFCLEIKAYGGSHRYNNESWEIFMGGDVWKKEEWNPALQATLGAKRVAAFLASRGLQIRVEPRIVWTGTGHIKLIGRPRVPIWFLRHAGVATNLDVKDWIRRDLAGSRPNISAEFLLMISQALAAAVRNGYLHNS